MNLSLIIKNNAKNTSWCPAHSKLLDLSSNLAHILDLAHMASNQYIHNTTIFQTLIYIKNIVWVVDLQSSIFPKRGSDLLVD